MLVGSEAAHADMPAISMRKQGASGLLYFSVSCKDIAAMELTYAKDWIAAMTELDGVPCAAKSRRKLNFSFCCGR